MRTVSWPVWNPATRRTTWRQVRESELPPGWQGMGIRIFQRLATCEEVECPQFLSGWTEAPGGPFVGDQRAQWGGVYHEAGIPCGRVHKTAAPQPPVFLRNGQPIAVGEFTERMGESVHAVQTMKQRG